MLHSNWRACSASSVPHRSSCWRPISPSWAPVSHITSPGSSATNVQLAPKKNGLRPVGPARATNLFEPSSGLSARRSYLWSLRCPRFPLWALASPMADLATPCTPGAQLQLRNTRALHKRSLLSATCATSWAEEASSLLCGFELLSDGAVSRLPIRWSSLQEYVWQFILLHNRLLAIVRHAEDPWDGRRSVARDRRVSILAEVDVFLKGAENLVPVWLIDTRVDPKV